eukprot:m.78205 g.78205  ORF g.78205 m.78205 type:complete len:709 (+) comp17341_c0_seq3:286-2412(+)
MSDSSDDEEFFDAESGDSHPLGVESALQQQDAHSTPIGNMAENEEDLIAQVMANPATATTADEGPPTCPSTPLQTSPTAPAPISKLPAESPAPAPSTITSAAATSAPPTTTTTTVAAVPEPAVSAASAAVPDPVAPPRRRKKKGDSTTASTEHLADPVADADNAAADAGTATALPAATATPTAITTSAAVAATATGEGERDAGQAAESAPISPLPSKTGQKRSSFKTRKPTPTDEEILESVTIKCLDTGETVPLSQMETLLPKDLNPLSLQMIRRCNEYPDAAGDKPVSSAESSKRKLKSFLAKAKDKMRSLKDDSRKEDKEMTLDGDGRVKVCVPRKEQPPSQRQLLLKQQLIREHMGPVWTMKFSSCARLLATAGQDQIVRVWVRCDAYDHMRKLRPAPESEAAASPDSAASSAAMADGRVFMPTPLCEYRAHTADVLDLSWSHTGNLFLLSSSMDKTVRLWHVTRNECLACFLHDDFVTAIAFHPKNDKFFISGSLDSKLRLWNIADKRVYLWNEVPGVMITAASFCKDGQIAVVGTYDGRCIFFNTEDRLRYLTHISVRSSRGKNSKGEKVSGIEVMPGEDKILISSNDSRLRLYDLKDHSLVCKYKGATNERSQIRAMFSSDGRSIICGSENHCVYIWHTQPERPPNKKSWRRDRNNSYEYFRAHTAVVTSAVFSPRHPELIVTADYSGSIKVMVDDNLVKKS